MMNTVQFGQATAPTGPEPVEGQPTPPPPVPEQKHFNWHWRRWILVCLAVIVLSSAIAYIAYRPQLLSQTQSPKPTPTPQITQTTPTPTPDPTASWKTFSGKNFLFKYPQSWTNDTGSIDPENIESISFRISPSDVFEAAYKNSSYSKSLESFTDRSSETTTVGSREAVRFETTSSMGVLPFGYAIITVVIKGSNETSYLINFNGDRKDITDSLIDQILSTFKFTDQTSYTCPATEWVDCMPRIVPDGQQVTPRPQCEKEYLNWAQANCPGFQGAAY